jgi:hypothetical protein
MASPIKTIAEILGLYPQTNDVNQVPYCFTDTQVMVGWPLTSLQGLDFIRCRFLAPRAKRFSSLGGGSVFLSNRNTSGEIELRFAQGAFSLAHLELFDASGVPMPIAISDISSGGTGTVIGVGCRVIDKGEFAREAEAPMVTLKLEVDRMVMFHGLRLPAITI